METLITEVGSMDIDRARAGGPASRCFHELFRDQAQRTPNAVAAAYQDQELTYAELDRRANALAHRLCALGVGADVLVGICIERSLEMMIGILGILKAGGAYVPLDPTYPRDRLDFMIDDSGARIILTQSWLRDRLPAQEPGLLICLDWICSTGSEELADAPPRNVQSANLAYVIYTSGSTGKPKGVMIEHGGLANYLICCAERYQVSFGTGALVHSTISFDLTITGLFLPLLVGRTVFLLPHGPGIEPLISAWRRMRNLSLIKITPAHLQLLSAQLEPHEASGRTRALIIGGESLSAENVAFWLKHAPDTMLINEYGPTETVVGCCIYQVPRQGSGAGPVPIGRPLADTQLHILDANGSSVPAGAAGELYIGGAGVARGYLNRPDLTRERFLPDPFSNVPGRRLYRTGDLARCRTDGNLEFLGRFDDQVKIRGFRIELPEIEATLREHAAVMDTAALAREDTPGDKRLVAYLVLHKDRSLSEDEALDFLRQRLPEYMMPAALVFLPALPLTSSGKVDRRALPAPAPRALAPDRPGEAPRDPLELQLVTLLEEVLHVRPVGIHDDFFALGGNSLLAADLMARIFKRTRRKLPLATLLQAPTVAKLAHAIGADGSPAGWNCLVPIQPNGSRRPFFCVHPMGGNVLMYRDLPRYLGPEQPVFGFQAKGLDGKHRPHAKVSEMAAHYIAEMQSLQPRGPYRLGGLSFGGIIAFEMAQQLQAAKEEVSLLVLFDTTTPGYVQPAVMRLPAHFEHFRTLGTRARLHYLRKKAGAVVTGICGVFWRVAYQFCRLSGLPLPGFLWNLSRLDDVAEKNYVVQPYAGRAVLFRAKEQFLGTHADPLLGWKPYIAGGIEVHEIPGSHAEIVEEPHVQTLAPILHRCLQSDG